MSFAATVLSASGADALLDRSSVHLHHRLRPAHGAAHTRLLQTLWQVVGARRRCPRAGGNGWPLSGRAEDGCVADQQDAGCGGRPRVGTAHRRAAAARRSWPGSPPQGERAKELRRALEAQAATQAGPPPQLELPLEPYQLIIQIKAGTSVGATREAGVPPCAAGTRNTVALGCPRASSSGSITAPARRAEASSPPARA